MEEAKKNCHWISTVKTPITNVDTKYDHSIRYRSSTSKRFVTLSIFLNYTLLIFQAREPFICYLPAQSNITPTSNVGTLKMSDRGRRPSENETESFRLTALFFCEFAKCVAEQSFDTLSTMCELKARHESSPMAITHPHDFDSSRNGIFCTYYIVYRKVRAKHAVHFTGTWIAILTYPRAKQR